MLTTASSCVLLAHTDTRTRLSRYVSTSCCLSRSSRARVTACAHSCVLLAGGSQTSQSQHGVHRNGGQRTASRVVLITSVFGKHPPYVPLFLKTAAHSGVDVILVGDTDAISGLPSNVRQINMTWEHLVGRVSKIMFDGKPLPKLLGANRYKVIDLKPAFGALFREYITAYDFW